MTEVPVRVLNQDTASVMARVKGGEEITITERGVVIAKLIPAQPSPLADLIASGKLRPATAQGPFPRPSGPVRGDREAGELLRAMRDEERY
jgi:prevent-host-death family protein